jgi:hypothetical protein
MPDALPSHDLNRSLEIPGSEGFKEGAVRIISDDDFYPVAHLPWEFSGLSVAAIASVLWPELEEAVFRPDSGDFWWEAIADETLEVPGQPHELWFHVEREGKLEESFRYDAYATLQDVDDGARRMCAGASVTDGAVWQVRTWVGGQRIDGPLMDVNGPGKEILTRGG